MSRFAWGHCTMPIMDTLPPSVSTLARRYAVALATDRPRQAAMLTKAFAALHPTLELCVKSFDEGKHPRGQPDNHGQFGPGGDSVAPVRATEKKQDEKPSGKHPIPKPSGHVAAIMKHGKKEKKQEQRPAKPPTNRERATAAVEETEKEQGVKLSEGQKKSIVEQFKSNSKAKEFAIEELPDGGKRANFYVPSKTPEGKKGFFYEYDAEGRETKAWKTTVTPSGKVFQTKYVKPPPEHWVPPDADPKDYV